MLKRVDQAVQSVSTSWADGKFSGGTTMTLGLKEDGVGYVKSDKIAAEASTKADEYAAKIKDGSLVIPSSYEELETFTANLPK